MSGFLWIHEVPQGSGRLCTQLCEAFCLIFSPLYSAQLRGGSVVELWSTDLLIILLAYGICDSMDVSIFRSYDIYLELWHGIFLLIFDSCVVGKCINSYCILCCSSYY